MNFAMTSALPVSDDPLLDIEAERFGQRLRQFRKDKGMTQNELADHLGVSIPAISAWEKGRSLPRDHRLTALAEILGIPLSTLASTAMSDHLGELMDRCRRQISQALGVNPHQIRISVDF
jgi:transcriptional regulator with XRE-family HTH domain